MKFGRFLFCFEVLQNTALVWFCLFTVLNFLIEVPDYKNWTSISRLGFEKQSNYFLKQTDLCSVLTLLCIILFNKGLSNLTKYILNFLIKNPRMFLLKLSHDNALNFKLSTYYHWFIALNYIFINIYVYLKGIFWDNAHLQKKIL